MVRYERIELSSQLWKSHVMAIIPIPQNGQEAGICTQTDSFTENNATITPQPDKKWRNRRDLNPRPPQ